MATAGIKADQLDAVLVAYVEWHRHAHCVQEAYEAWQGSARRERARRFAAYLEELDREEQASEVYEGTLRRGAA